MTAADDGYSGTNYDRPDFKRLIADIERKKIDCVLTKDLSRLGRNSARTSDLLDEYFPSHGVRYISVIDGYDSAHLTNGIAMSTSFLMTMHELYARDISCKIRSSFQIKMQRGEYVASFAPYGYQKAPDNKNQLVIDEQTAPIVRRMFGMAENGASPKNIADRFNAEHILTPAMYRCYLRPYIDIETQTKRKSWDSAMVCKMLSNRVYLGHTVQGKTKKVSFKVKKSVRQRRDDWIVVENTHEPLISEETFENVRRRVVARTAPPTKGFHNIFSGIAVCADCHHSMTTAPTRKKGATYNLCCGTYKSRGSGECSNHFIDYDLLYNAVLADIRAWLSLDEDEKRKIAASLAERQESQKEEETRDTFGDILRAEKRKEQIGELIKNLFEAKLSGTMSDVMFEAASKQYEAELQELARVLAPKAAEPEQADSPQTQYEKFFALLTEVTACETLTRPLLLKLVERIEVEQGRWEPDEAGKRQKIQKIRICYRFIGCADEK
ncbi:MAG: recombinase family protein [Clostridia bacterium]|nr:recombinase family protein [Clostridia bacterium]